MRKPISGRIAWRAGRCTWVIALLYLPSHGIAHPLHSEAIERPCALVRQGDDVSRVAGRCSFFVAMDYLIFQLDASPGDGNPEPRVVSGAFNLAQSTGSIFVTDGSPLAEGAVTLADRSPQVVHMQPGTLATWTNGFALEVAGTSVKAEGSIATVPVEDPRPLGDVFAAYVEQGFVHIVPLGFDHILFVIGLFLLSPQLKPLLWQVSAFTLAHTLTLALGASGVIRLPAGIVEPLIALSIVWVAVENLLTDKLHRWRIAVVFLFGLLHGLGFAGVLLEIGLSGAHFASALLAFNVGVELGQLSVIALCFLSVGWAMRRPYYHGRIVAPASCLIALVAAYWVFERTFPRVIGT